MTTFEERVDRLAEALDEAAADIRRALQWRGQPQKVLANRVHKANPTLVSRWLSGAQQLAESNRLPGTEVMREIAEVLKLPPDKKERLVGLGATIDELRKLLEDEDRRWRARAGEYYGARRRAGGAPEDAGGAADGPAFDRAGDGAAGAAPGGPPPGGDPAARPVRQDGVRRDRLLGLLRWRVPLPVAAGLALVMFFAGTFVNRPEEPAGAAPERGGATPGEHRVADGERCSPWTETEQGVQVEACIRIRESRMLIRNRLRGPVGTKTDMVVQAYDTFAERPVTRELKCHQMYINAEGEIKECGWYEVRPPYGSEYGARAGWRTAGTAVFGNYVVSPGLEW